MKARWFVSVRKYHCRWEGGSSLRSADIGGRCADEIGRFEPFVHVGTSGRPYLVDRRRWSAGNVVYLELHVPKWRRRAPWCKSVMRVVGKGGCILIPRIQVCSLGFSTRGGNDGWEALCQNPRLVTMMRLFNPMRHGGIGVGGQFIVIVGSVPLGGSGARPRRFRRELKSIFP